ncbi:Pyridoxamine 5'-phosphate oxidase [Indibacter alkaliphilus LW1]|jgi:pyridoxamine 5'-phosphate oxidase|uniref:Pyridoxine/pyridoxamine 5'-phosphate oxidase n=1 Tax=Indibacter alkaliphilus (strain CCUG 57479 / KCTC 22604 / LW1) TaxID=1189612 RepID=S2DJ35_INDAL|nr:pyridoxamine 5'-phosphate oxidase [Indibacter alkaliphilus]EOZ98982.1 Pyridoxamine 5'-phosphate oxidase [Indibacter alkaliphilus LW1]
MEIADIRKEYSLQTLDITDVEKSPLDQFKNWFGEVLNSQVLEANAMNLSTIDKNGRPNSRIVLLKGVDHGFVFFTNYSSVKGSELADNPFVAATFHWAELERQVRISGKVEKISSEESDEYFFSRPFSSQIGAWVSPQSQEIPNREFLEIKEKELNKKLTPETIKRPEHWGGFRIIADQIEFWQGRPSRLHDRILYVLQNSGDWKISRLAP